MTKVAIEAVRLTKRFGDSAPVSELSFTASEGEIVGLLGPNGAGKTTIVRLLSTVLAPTSGSFSVAGIPGERPLEIRRRVGVLPESSGYPGYLTGEAYLRYHGRLFGLPRRAAADTAARLLSEVGLAERARSRISTYSRGMRQRLGIARALVNNPAVVLLDEPTLGLDPAGQRQVLRIVRDIAVRGGATVMLSSHILSEIEQTCTRVLILDHGRMIMSSAIEQAGLIGTRRCGHMKVPLELVGVARKALTEVTGLTVESTKEDPDILTICTAGRDGQKAADDEMNAALLAVLRHDVPVLSFEVGGTRLSDAFLALTGGVR
jgi:ABC-2 type transport system ATP-binding protein